MLKHTAKRSLGQNFLTAESVVGDIVMSGQVVPSDTVLEIGPGKGVLTKKLLETGCTVIAVEKDDSLYDYLSKEFSDYIARSNLALIHGDILELLPELSLPANYKLIANIPYNITGKIISDFLSSSHRPTKMVLMVQHEVALRITERGNKSSILSMAVSAYGKPKLIKRVSAGSFFPKPRVDSAVLLIDCISDKFFTRNNIQEKDFFIVLKSGFAHKRKKLQSNLRDLGVLKPWELVFDELGLSQNTRAEDITIKTWADLTRNLL